jgi:hypothetical protein
MLQLIFTIIILYIIFERFSNEYNSPLNDSVKNTPLQEFNNTEAKDDIKEKTN